MKLGENVIIKPAYFWFPENNSIYLTCMFIKQQIKI